MPGLGNANGANAVAPLSTPVIPHRKEALVSIAKDHPPTVGAALSMFVGALISWGREDLVPWVAQWVPSEVATSGWLLVYAGLAVAVGAVVERRTIPVDLGIDAETVLTRAHQQADLGEGSGDAVDG